MQIGIVTFTDGRQRAANATRALYDKKNTTNNKAEAPPAEKKAPAPAPKRHPAKDEPVPDVPAVPGL